MNKITVVKDNIIKELDDTCIYQDYKLQIVNNCNIFLSFSSSDIPFLIEISPNVSAVITVNCENSKNKIQYNLLKNSKVEVIKLAIDCSDQVNINLKEENAIINYHYSTINKEENTFKVKVNHISSKTESNVISHGVNLKQKPLTFQVDGIVLKESNQCICNQDSKIIELDQNTSCIKPNLLIDNYDVEANHAAYIGSFNNDDLFYLMSRGVPKEKCYELLLEGFLLGNIKIEQEQKDRFLNYIKVGR